ncbi:hypothetical protein JI750_09290 [Flavobacterium sp. GN10]|uniref:Tox-MPTase2 domain-containing protein n=1 Tax=Flavobacterium tagetis TaxID=2801336 RepID=A0ABS1KFZ2_9FLAO|nr:hypothetical protein [Flavobacterium tagetis]MBL0737076.1 hypothetical protein [Flavobacterium tagetis]
MRVLKKMSFDALIENISIEDMKFIMAGSGSVVNGSSYTQQMGGGGSGNMWFYATDRGLSSQFSPAGTLLFASNGNYNDPSISSNQNTYGYGSANYGSNYNSGYGSGSVNSNAQGWTSTGNGIVTTNPNDINRFINFVGHNSATNPQFSWNNIADFLNKEQTVEGRAYNNAVYGAILLNEVIVYNTYKGPSSIPQGIDYSNGVLRVGVMMGSGGVMMGSNVYMGNDTNTSYNPFVDDYVFNDNGSFIGVQDITSGHNIKISIGGKLCNLSDLDTSTLANNSGLITKIATFFATKAGLSTGFVGVDYSTEQSSSVLAFTKSDGTVYLNANGGISKLLDNYDNLTNVLKHEQFHQIEFANNKKTDFETHVKVYLQQFNDASFANTTSEFKLGQIASVTNYLMNMDRNDPDNLYNRNTIISQINTFNEMKTGYQIMNDVSFGLNPSQLRLSIRDSNGKMYEINYSQLKN